MEVTRIFDLLSHYESEFQPKEDVLVGKENGKWVKHNLKKYRQTANEISCALLSMGVKKGDKIATISNNRPEWNFVDMGIMQVGAIHVPIYPTISEDDYQYILKHAEVKYVFVAGKELIRKMGHILSSVDNIIDAFTFTHVDGYKHYNEILKIGRENFNQKELDRTKREIRKDDVATIIYTSGTTGYPKGVMLSHNNILSNVKACHGIFHVNETSRGLSYLPLCHVYERTVNYILHYKGVSIYYAENMATIVDNIQDVKPHIMTTVPRLLEKVYDRIVAKGRKLRGFKKKIFFWALDLGLRYEYDKPWRLLYNIQLHFAGKMVFSKWREAFGGEMVSIVSGGAALQPRLSRVYNAAGIPVVEGYGMTESSPVIAVNTYVPHKRKIGTVGPLVSNVKVKISEDGEILVKGPNVMKGYFRDDEMTKSAVVNGWLHTGDVGVIDKNGMLKITGRIKEIFKTSMGKYISPVLIENKIKESPFIDQIIVLGENQKFAAALVVPDFDQLGSWCRYKGISKFNSSAEMIKDKSVREKFKREIDTFNKNFGDSEKIKKFELIDHEWTINSGEITANLKLKRAHIQKKYDDKIKMLFA